MQLIGGYQINGGDLSTMTPLQLIATNCINDIIFKWKSKNEPFAVI